jgi:hypothetical protein
MTAVAPVNSASPEMIDGYRSLPGHGICTFR